MPKCSIRGTWSKQCIRYEEAGLNGRHGTTYTYSEEASACSDWGMFDYTWASYNVGSERVIDYNGSGMFAVGCGTRSGFSGIFRYGYITKNADGHATFGD